MKQSSRYRPATDETRTSERDRDSRVRDHLRRRHLASISSANGTSPPFIRRVSSSLIIEYGDADDIRTDYLHQKRREDGADHNEHEYGTWTAASGVAKGGQAVG